MLYRVFEGYAVVKNWKYVAKMHKERLRDRKVKNKGRRIQRISIYDTTNPNNNKTTTLILAPLTKQAGLITPVPSATQSRSILRKQTDGYGRISGATENARPDIARLDNAAPYRKGGHRETCFSVRVEAHYKFMSDSGSIIWAAHRFYVCNSISFCFTYCCVRQTKLASSLVSVWAHYI